MSNRKNTLSSVFLNGILSENPTFRLVLGICPTLAVTVGVLNALGMGASVTFVLIGSNVVISLLRNFIPDKVRIPCFVIIICTFVTMVQLLIKAFVPVLDSALGIFIPLIVVNCIILARAEAFASKNGVALSAMDGLGMGVGFTLATTVIAALRELIGAGTFLGMPVFGAAYEPMLIVGMAAGGFMMFGLSLGAFNLIVNYLENKKAREGGARS